MIQRFCTDASGDESSEGGEVDGNATVVEVVQDGDGLVELVLPSESLNVFVNETWVSAVEW